ncbi:MAG: hypothetical protein ABIF10_02270 [Candidatus Woesearchaeota archaeon]
MKSLVFDAGPIISLTMNNLLWILPKLKERFKGEFFVALSVKQEVVDRPLLGKEYKFEALQAMRLVEDKVLQVADSEEIRQLGRQLLDIANRIYLAKGHPISVVHRGEMESVAAALSLNASAIVVDERTTRMLLEDPVGLAAILERKLHTPVRTDKDMLQKFQEQTKSLVPIRSLELALVAYELGFLDKFLFSIENPRETLLDAMLWGLKLDGCAVSQDEIAGIISLESRR